MALRAAMLHHVKVPVQTLPLAAPKLHFWNGFFRSMSSHDDHITKEEVIHRVLSVLKDFPKLDTSKSKNWVEEEVIAKGISDEHKDLLIKGSKALLVPALVYKDGFGFILRYAASDDFCEMVNNKLDKSKDWAEQEIRSRGISVENLNLDLLMKASGALLLAPAIGYYGGLGSACGFLLKYAASDDYCREMVKIGFEKSKYWTEEKIREKGISDELRDLVVQAGGATLAAAAAAGYYGGACGFLFRNGDGSVADGQNLMKAPGRPGEFIARDVFEANPRAYFRDLREKLP